MSFLFVQSCIFVVLTDTKGPVVVFTKAEPTTSSSPVFEYSSKDVVKFQCSLDGADYESCGEGLTGQWRKDNVPSGRHTLKVKGTDNLGIEGTPAVHTWTVGEFFVF